MLKRPGTIMVWLMLALFVAVLAWIVSLRLGSGDIYPEYSTLRSDPLGSKAFYESLDRLPGRNIRRNLHVLTRLSGQPGESILFLGTNPYLAPTPEFYEEVERLARNGARVVVAINATASHSATRESDRINSPGLPIKNDDTNENEKEEGKPGEETKPVVPGMRAPDLTLLDPLKLDPEQVIAELTATAPGLPNELSWYGRYCFEKLSDEWEIIYEAKGKPVVIQQDTGLGTIVLSADAYHFSNEALAGRRAPAFLLWTLGQTKNVIFDESHLGVRHGNSIMLLLRDFRLQGLFFGFLLVAALWIWRASTSFVPPYVEVGSSEVVEGKMAREGVVHLMERNLPADELPQVCLAEWRKSHPNLNPFDATRYADAEQLVKQYLLIPRKERNPIQAYHEITKLLSK